MSLPSVTRTYLNPHLDSSRWQVYTPRVDDIVVTTSYKSGTTFTQQILYNLLVRNTVRDETFPNLDDVSPWVDSRFYPVPMDKLGDYLESFETRRFLKSHLPLDGLPYFSQVKYIIVARDPRDVFVSLLNHYRAYTPAFYEKVTWPGEATLPRFDGNVSALWKNWITKGWFEWEMEGYPFWSNMHHTQSYWDFRHLPNFLFLHYADMLADLDGSIKRIAQFIELDLSDEQIQAASKAVRFDQVKRQAIAESRQTSDQPEAFEGGQATFINKGTNGRWRELLTIEDLAMYAATRDKVLTPDCANWLERE
jgi:aryl sulfotransferase